MCEDSRAEEILDLSGKGIKRLERCGNGNVQWLILDKNELTRLENAESYGDLKKLSATENKLVRMYGVCRLVHLTVLNLADNCVVAIEGLRDLVHLTEINLSGNKIKMIEHLNTNVALRYLDLSNNSIQLLGNLSHLRVLRTLLLSGNALKTLNNAQNFLPTSLSVLSVANNLIGDLNEVSFLSGLRHLEALSVMNNPCIDMTESEVGYDYRPFVINWCLNLKVLDGFVIGSKENLKAEWLYSMGKGRYYQIGEHAELVNYLANVCPLTTADDLMTEEDAKLNRILSKRREHQQQLLSETAADDHVRPSTAPATSGYRPPNILLPSPGTSRPKSVIPTRSTGTGVRQGKRASDGSSGNDAAESTSQIERDRRHSNFDSDPCVVSPDDITSCIASSEVPSDVPNDSGQDRMGLDGDLAPLRSETQYVPVPETMLSPDFRPVTSSLKSPFLDVAGASCSDALAPSPDSDIRQKWLSPRSSIPRTSPSNSPRLSMRKTDGRTNRRARNATTDSPLLRRPTQVQRLQRNSRPVSLSPSCGRRPTPTGAPQGKLVVRSAAKENSSDDDSADSDISLSKLSLLKGMVRTKLDTMVKQKARSSPRSGESTTKKHHLPKQNNRRLLEQDPITNGNRPSLYQKSAEIIQSAWRGYRTRNYDATAVHVRQEIRVRRAEDHIRFLQEQLAGTRKELENEKRLRSLQMEAIRALWKEVQHIQMAQAPFKQDQEKQTPSDSGLESPSCMALKARPRGAAGGTGVTTSTNFPEPPPTGKENANEESLETHAVVERASPDVGDNYEISRSVYSESASVMSSSIYEDSLMSVSQTAESLTARSALSQSDATTTSMISHLNNNCQTLQHQMQQLQDALRTMSGLLLGPHLQYRVAPESVSGALPQFSSPFASAMATSVAIETPANTTMTGSTEHVDKNCDVQNDTSPNDKDLTTPNESPKGSEQLEAAGMDAITTAAKESATEPEDTQQQ